MRGPIHMSRDPFIRVVIPRRPAARPGDTAHADCVGQLRARLTFEDPSGVYPSPRSSAPTAFTILTGSSNQFFGVGPGSTTGVTEIAGYRFNFNAPSSAGASAAPVVNQAGVG
jgi:hypothetical protein